MFIGVAVFLGIAVGSGACGNEGSADETDCVAHEECAGLCTEGLCGPPDATTCPGGFADNGSMCVDDDECADEGTGNDCDLNATCTNTPGDFTCTCNVDFSGSGTSCVSDVVSASGAPTLSNYRVTDADKTRVYFDSSENIAGSTVTGFVVSGMDIASVTIVAGANTGHYFTVAGAFTFWDNNTIRYTGGSDLRDTGDSAGVWEFDLQYIKNLVAEPTATTNTYYVATTGDNDALGTSEGEAWRTIEFATTQVSAGTTVWIKAGDYGNENITVTIGGSSDNPVKFIGYQTAIGDSPNLNWDYSKTSPWDIENRLQPVNGFDSTIMPLVSGNDESTGRGFEVQTDFVIVRNIQVEHYDRLIAVNGSRDAVLIDNCYSSNGTYGFLVDSASNTRISITNSLAFRTRTTGVRLYGDHNRVDETEVWDDRFDEMNSYSNDYYIVYNGSNNIIRNSRIERYGNTDHWGHGFSCKDKTTPAEYNLVENGEAVGIQLSFELWGGQVQHNVLRNMKAWHKPTTDKRSTGGVDLLGNASNNTLDGIRVNDAMSGVFSTGGTDNNTFKNCVFVNNTRALRIDAVMAGNQFINCTFHQHGGMVGMPGASASTNVFTNCLISDTPDNGADSSTFAYSNFYNSFSTPNGTGNVSLDPKFVDVDGGDFHLIDGSPVEVKAGGTTTNVHYDADGVQRVVDAYSIGAYQLN